ncbi:hypothetical protein DQ244_03775 [Blastococcus sp. TBT05-19]|uniref:hypothetical protein n=1 Tax=Blastococcus sp. TBT05-19 TaxID=2250581 RepID=UPI000DEB5A45|nr:hypothetical protein [Blastococcus sp. TBT05-19]RBY94443.1 hypothetical protein DQ244_03775 [Blastococcus sp. TBT05-19]
MNRAKSRQRWRRRSPRAERLPGAPSTREHRPDERHSGLARARSGLQRAALLLVLLVFPAVLAMILAAGANAPSASVGVRLQEKWGPLIPVVLGVPAALLLVAAWAVRFLPGGAEAAAIAPMFRPSRGGGPKRVSVAAVAGLVTLLVFTPGMAVEAYQGVRALSGGGLVLTVGEDTYVTRTAESSGRGGGTNYYLDTPSGEAIAEGDPSDGDRYGVYPPSAHRAWKMSATGWLSSAVTWVLVLGVAAGTFFLARSQLRRHLDRRRRFGPGRRPAGALAVAYTSVAALLAVGSAGWVVVDEVSAGGTRAPLDIPGAEEFDLSSFWVSDGEGRDPFFSYHDDVAAPLQSRRLNENHDDDLGQLDIWATVTRYPTAEDAEEAARLWLAEEAAAVRGLYEAKGGELALGDGTSAVWNEELTQMLTATNRGSVLVTVEVDDHGWEDGPDEVEARLQRDAPRIRDLLVDSSDRILDVELPWWG